MPKIFKSQLLFSRELLLQQVIAEGEPDQCGRIAHVSLIQQSLPMPFDGAPAGKQFISDLLVGIAL